MNKPHLNHKNKYADYNRVKGRKWMVDNKKICINNKVYILNYNVSIASDNNFLVLEEQGVLNITCNLDPSSLLITFPSQSSMNQFASQIVPVTTFITSRTSPFFCHNKPLLRRIFAAEEYSGSTNTLLLSLSDSRYDEIFDKAHISFGTSLETCNQPTDPKVAQTYPSLNNPSSAHFCLGINANEQCTNSSQPLELYNNQYITITCQDCFFALTGDVFLEVHIDLFECLSFSGGFVNLEMLGALILQLQAHLDWSAGINKNLPIGGEVNLLNFYIGPIPVHLYFLLDLGLVFNSQFDFTATATIGTSFNYTWNDWYVKWGLLSGWEHVHPAPVITWTPVVSGEAGFQASTTFSLIPSYGFHVDNFFSTTYNFDPSLTAAAQWNTTTNALCAELTYASALTVSSQLSLNIPFSSKQTTVWGPRTIWESSGTIGKYCS